MAYTPTTWNRGDTVTSTKLNKLEQGVANAGNALICTCNNNGNDYVLDKTVQEIYDAMESGTPVYVTYTYGVPVTNYESNKFFAQIIKIYTYNYAETIRVVATWTNLTAPAIGDGGSFLHGPAMAVFSANGMNGYPVYYRTVKVDSSSLASVSGMIY